MHMPRKDIGHEAFSFQSLMMHMPSMQSPHSMKQGGAGGSTTFLSSFSAVTRNLATSFLNFKMVSELLPSSTSATFSSGFVEASISISITKFSTSSTFLESFVWSDLLHSQQKECIEPD